jgi:uncharacterized protein
MSKEIEHRRLQVELRTEEGETPKIVGHAAVFDKPADIYGFEEVVRAGAFTESIKKDDVRMLWNHNPDHVLGRTKSGTLRLIEDKVGLAIENDPPDTQLARDLMISMERGDVDQMSFGFIVEEEKWSKRNEEPDLREILKARLFDVSPVTYPAYEETDVSVALRNAPDDVRKRLLPAEDNQVVTEADKDTEQEQGLKLKLKRMKLI